MTSAVEHVISAQEEAIAAQELAIAATAPLFVRACPGAGKTHVIVSRHLRGPAAALRQGRALLSFTRAAAAQMRSRCHRESRPDAALFPHYIGTLDACIWEVLVVPNLPAGQTLQLVDSWDRVQAEVQLDRQVPLSAFTFQRDPISGKESIREDLLSHEHTRLISTSKFGWEIWSKKAFAVRDDQMKAGYVTGHESRLLALKYLESGENFTGPLRSRFAEIVVDEAQDCSVTDLELLDRLHHIGIPLVVVADPDQMIYGWRDADLARLSSLEGQLGQTIELTGNWRSSATVCRLAATLRAGSRPPDLAVRSSTPEPPVILLPTRFPKGSAAQHAPSQRPVVDVFLEHAETYAVGAADCLVTAYRRTHLPAKGRRPAGNAATLLAHAWRVVHSGTADPDQVDDALRISSRLLIRYWYPDVAASGSIEARCTTADVEFSHIIRHAYAFLHALPEPHAEWHKDVNAQLKTWPCPPNAAPRGTIGQLRGKPEGTKLSRTTAAPYRSDNIHQVKGDEHEGVLLLVPDDDAASHWASGNPSADELLRNWYVAVTRARRLLAIAIPPDDIDQLTEHLHERHVPLLLG
ncbi:UvrD-helicase domain-containing protein [Actinophytocola sp. KF-1]